MTPKPVDAAILVEKRLGSVLLLRMQSACGRNPVSPRLSGAIRDAVARANAR